MGIMSAKTEKVASKGMRFLFAPQLFSKTSSPKYLLAGFVQLIAQFLAGAKLIPATHRSLRPLSPQDARLGEVLALSYATVRAPGARMDQIAVFGAVATLLAMVALQMTYIVGSLLIGTAHAGFLPQFSVLVCSFSASTSYFEAPCATDMAQNWIDLLLLGVDPASDSKYWFTGMVMSMPLRSGMSAMFQTYSYAMLVLAGFLVMYHLLTVVAGTAHEGRLGGKVMNQIWAPIRLIMAIGMLVPLGGNGLNGGQFVAVQAAKWGSAMASNIWVNFASAFGAATTMNMGSFIVVPPLMQASPIVRDALKILICERTFADAAAKTTNNFEVVRNPPSGGGGGLQWYKVAGGSTIETTWDYYGYTNSTKSTLNDSNPKACGSISMPDPNYSTGGQGVEYLSNGNWYNASYSIRKAILMSHVTAIDKQLAVGSSLSQMADALYNAADTSNTGYQLTEDDIFLFNTAVGEYRTELIKGIVQAILNSSLSSLSMVGDATARGWVSAAVWFNSISRINGMLMDVVQQLPTIEPRFAFYIVDGVGAGDLGRVAIATADEAIGLLPTFASTGTKTLTTFNEPDFLQGIGTATAGLSHVEMYMNMLATNFKKIMGATSASNDEIQPTDLGAISGYASPLQLNTSNPLGELSAIGLRIINLAMTATKAMEACQAQSIENANKLAAENKAGGPGMGPSVGLANGACGASSFTGTGPGVFLIQASTGALIAAGVTLGFLLPLMPFIRFLFGILTWILSMFETVIAIPVVALAHIKMDGDGIAGPMARSAYLLLLQVFLRPALMIFGLVLALVLFNVMIVALNEFYTGAVRSTEAGGSLGAIATVVYTVIYGSLAYALANASFKAIDLVPSQCLQWIGGPVQQGIDGMQTVQGAVSQTSTVAHGAITGAATQTQRQIGYNRL